MTRNSRSVAILLTALALSCALAPAAVQAQSDAERRPSLALRLPSALRQQQLTWVQDTAAVLDDTAEQVNLTNEEDRLFREVLNSTMSAYRGHRWLPVLDGVLNLRHSARFAVLEREASQSDAPHEVFLEATREDADAAVAESIAARKRLNATTAEVETTVGVELLYLAAQRIADGNEKIRAYPQYRSAVAASGNRTIGPVYQQLVATAVMARVNMELANDLIDLAVLEDANGDGAPVNTTRLPAAWRDLGQTVGAQRPRSAMAANLLESLNYTTARGEWLLSVAIAEAYVQTATFGDLQRRIQQEATTRVTLEETLRDLAGDLGPLADVSAAGYAGVTERDAIAGSLAVLGRGGDGGPGATEADLALAISRVESTRVANGALLTLAAISQPDPEGEDDGGPVSAEGGLPTATVVAALVVGALVGGAGVALALRRGRDD